MTQLKDLSDAGDALLRMDHQVHEAAEPDRTSTPVKVIGTLSDAGDQLQLRLLCSAVIAWGVIRRNPRMIGAGARMLLSHELATAAKSAVKHRVDRTRPRSASGKEDEAPHPGHDSDKEENSFPSGHSAGAMAVAGAFSAVYPEHRKPALAAAAAVALAQIPRCAHYPTDVGAGLAIGAASDGIVGLAWKLVLRVMSRR